MNSKEIMAEMRVITNLQRSNTLLQSELENIATVLLVRKMRIQEDCPHDGIKHQRSEGSFDDYKQIEICAICGKEL